MRFEIPCALCRARHEIGLGRLSGGERLLARDPECGPLLRIDSGFECGAANEIFRTQSENCRDSGIHVPQSQLPVEPENDDGQTLYDVRGCALR